MKCQRCGSADNVSTHSGVDECSGCWNYRKLDLPAAQHWHKVAGEFLSNVDMYDMMTYLPEALSGDDKVDITYAQMLRAVQAVMVHSKRVCENGPYHTWESK
jgi:hypothetical protein